MPLYIGFLYISILLSYYASKLFKIFNAAADSSMALIRYSGGQIQRYKSSFVSMLRCEAITSSTRLFWYYYSSSSSGKSLSNDIIVIPKAYTSVLRLCFCYTATSGSMKSAVPALTPSPTWPKSVRSTWRSRMPFWRIYKRYYERFFVIISVLNNFCIRSSSSVRTCSPNMHPIYSVGSISTSKPLSR